MPFICLVFISINSGDKTVEMLIPYNTEVEIKKVKLSVNVSEKASVNIDPEIEEALFEILQGLNKRMTILLVSHDLGFVSQKVNSVICVNRCVVVHPTSEINGTIIKDIYGGDICMIRHDHRCGEEGHQHD